MKLKEESLIKTFKKNGRGNKTIILTLLIIATGGVAYICILKELIINIPFLSDFANYIIFIGSASMLVFGLTFKDVIKDILLKIDDSYLLAILSAIIVFLFIEWKSVNNYVQKELKKYNE